jgi:hypothetical protein
MSNPMPGIWAFASNDVWVVGFYGNIGHWDGATWSLVASPTAQNLFAVSGASASDLWAVGEGGVILHYSK